LISLVVLNEKVHALYLKLGFGRVRETYALGELESEFLRFVCCFEEKVPSPSVGVVLVNVLFLLFFVLFAFFFFAFFFLGILDGFSLIVSLLVRISVFLELFNLCLRILLDLH